MRECANHCCEYAGLPVQDRSKGLQRTPFSNLLLSWHIKRQLGSESPGRVLPSLRHSHNTDMVQSETTTHIRLTGLVPFLSNKSTSKFLSGNRVVAFLIGLLFRQTLGFYLHVVFWSGYMASFIASSPPHYSYPFRLLSCGSWIEIHLFAI
jgi:hypothetical protein